METTQATSNLQIAVAQLPTSKPAMGNDMDLADILENLVFKQDGSIDMDLSNKNRTLIHNGMLLRPPDNGFWWNDWIELFVLLFDNYLVITTVKRKDGVPKYHVNHRPILLDLLISTNFVDPAIQRTTRTILHGVRGGDWHDTLAAPSVVYPCTLLQGGRHGGLYTFYARTHQARAEWEQRIEEAIKLRKASNNVFKMKTFDEDTSFAGKVTCSVPFTTSDGQRLVAIGCEEGVWVGFHQDSRAMRRMLRLKMVSQCAVLENFGIFLVLASKSLFAYNIETLVPSSPPNTPAPLAPQKVNGTKDVQFFSVGRLGGDTLVIYMMKDGPKSVFRVLKPIDKNISKPGKSSNLTKSSPDVHPQRSKWFRISREFALPVVSFGLVFLRAKIAIMTTSGFEVMDLTDFKNVTMPQRDGLRLKKLAKRFESCLPKGIFHANNGEFLLVYDEFGLYVDKHGDPSRSSVIVEWEGTAEHVALSTSSPHILLFDRSFIEIRHIETGHLVQVMLDNDVRCLWDRRVDTPRVVRSGGGGQVRMGQVYTVRSFPQPNMKPESGIRS